MDEISTEILTFGLKFSRFGEKYLTFLPFFSAFDWKVWYIIPQYVIFQPNIRVFDLRDFDQHLWDLDYTLWYFENNLQLHKKIIEIASKMFKVWMEIFEIYIKRVETSINREEHNRRDIAPNFWSCEQND